MAARAAEQVNEALDARSLQSVLELAEEEAQAA
jgi:hypothetical protein